CGACCRHLPPHSSLNAGGGVCVHLDATTQRCGVYAQRPLICRVDDLYQQRLTTQLTPRVYYLVQAEGCVALALPDLLQILPHLSPQSSIEIRAE
ncbi:MAG: hypothetical protein EBV03_06735, partial [Proteobacteria bacterium]|nr:hypothetical protein [Pseudomonadota bacterium]